MAPSTMRRGALAGILVLLTGCFPTLGGKNDRDVGSARKGYTLHFYPKNGREYHYQYTTETRTTHVPAGIREDEQRTVKVDLVHRPREAALGTHKWVRMQFNSPSFTSSVPKAIPTASIMNDAAFHYALYEDGQIGEIDGILDLEPWRFGFSVRQMIYATYLPAPPNPVKIGGTWKSPVSYKYWDLDYRVELDLLYDFTLAGYATPENEDLLKVLYRASFQKRAQGRRKRLEGSGKVEGYYIYDTKMAMVTAHESTMTGKIEGDYDHDRLARHFTTKMTLKLEKGEVFAAGL